MRPVFRLVPDFIVPNLEKSTYGEHLHWEDKRNGSFKISRIHQSSEMWNDQCVEVYKDWSMIKKHWKISDKKRITKAKHRLITALRRSPEIEMLKKEALFYRFRVIQQKTSENELFDAESTLNEKTDMSSTLNESKKELQEISNLGEIEKENDKLCDEELILNEQVEMPSSLNGSKKEYQRVLNMGEIEKVNAKNDPMTQVQNSLPLLNSYEDGINFVFKPLVPLQNPMQRYYSIADDIFSDEFCTDEENTPESSDRCCCLVLPFDNFLCNQKCIWHGMPP